MSKLWIGYFWRNFHNNDLNSYLFSIERDAQLLANRIALLKQEEMRTWKKIEETKKRATEVVQLKQKNEMKIHQKMEQMRIQ